MSGLITAAVIIGSRKMGINPDNVATPIAASLGDLITLSVLAGVSSLFFTYKGSSLQFTMYPLEGSSVSHSKARFSVQCCSPDVWYLTSVVCIFFLLLIPVWVGMASHSPPIREVLKSGWQPVIVAMFISRLACLSSKCFFIRSVCFTNSELLMFFLF